MKIFKSIFSNYTIGILFGVPIRTNLLTLFYIIGLSSFFSEVSFLTAFAVLMILYYVIVLGHEFAHVLAAKHYGYETNEVCINIFGGLAFIPDSESMSHKESFVVSAAGPLFNVALIPLLYVMGSDLLLVFNILMIVFNLVPFYPLDGGRMLRAVIGQFVKNEVKLQYTTFCVSVFCFIGFMFLAFYYRNVMLSIVSILLLAINYIQLQKIKSQEKLDI